MVYIRNTRYIDSEICRRKEIKEFNKEDIKNRKKINTELQVWLKNNPGKTPFDYILCNNKN